jgi:glycosyltransferase involved in cell wall biosynthesis
MISVIIGTRYASEALDLLLESLLKYQKMDNEIIVVADNPSWQTLKLLSDRDFYHGGTNKHRCFIVNHRHLEMNWNFGVKEATFDYLAFTNDDVVVGPDWDIEIMKTMDNSQKKIVFLNHYQRAMKNDPSFRDFGSPEWKYSERHKKYWGSDHAWDWISFEKDCKSMQIRGDLGIFWVLTKELFNLAHGYSFCGAHPFSPELHFFERCKRLGATLEQVKTTGAYHWGSIGNSDMQNSLLGVSDGWFECSICGHQDPGVSGELFNVEPLSRLNLETGLYLCERCKKDGWRIESGELKK